MSEGKRPSLNSVTRVAWRFGIIDPEHMMDRDFGYVEIEKTRQGVINGELAWDEEAGERRAKASLSGDANADANYLALMSDPGYRPYLAMAL